MPEPTTSDRIPIVSLSAVLAPGGLTINITSAVFEQFFLGLNPTPRIRDNRELYGGARYYDFDTRFDDFVSGDIQDWGNRQLLISGKPNISILRAVGLSSGVEITIQTVLNKRQMGEYLKAFEEAAIEFYAQYVRAERYEMIITAQQITERD